MGHVIRHAILNDAKGIAYVHITSWQSAYRGLIPDIFLDNLPMDIREIEWGQRIKENASIFVVENKNQIEGFLHYCSCRDTDKISDKVAEICAMYLLGKIRRKGIGRKLLNAALDALKEIGFSEVTLWVLEENHSACNFYEKMGFHPTSDRKIALTIPGVSLYEIRYYKNLNMDKNSSLNDTPGNL